MRRYVAIKVKQREQSDITFLVLVAAARDVVQWSQADDIRLDKGNVQRALVESRWRQVKKFFAADANNTIPTSVTIAFSEDVQEATEGALSETHPGYAIKPLGGDLVEIVFSDAVRGHSFIIDGQHRLRGMAEVPEELMVPVSLFPSLSRLERAFQFVTINNKSHKVPTTNLKALITNFDSIEEGLRRRLTQASITVPKFATHVDVMNEDHEGPFYKLIDWVNNRHPDAKFLIAPPAIENSLRAINIAFPETKDDPADSITVLSAIWRTIFDHYGITFKNIGNYPNIYKKPVIQRLTEMVVDHLKREFDPVFSSGSVLTNDGHDAAGAAQRLVSDIPEQFWQDEWSMKGLDTGAGRDIIEQAIRALKPVIRKDLDADWRQGNPLYSMAGPDDE